MTKLIHHRVKLEQAQRFISAVHRHSEPLKRHMFTIGASEQGVADINFLYDGIVSIDNPSSAWSQYDFVAEIRRLAVTEYAPKNTASFLLGKAKQACFALGYELIVTYTKGYESGSSLKAAGFSADKLTGKAFTDGSVETLVRWGCMRNSVPDMEQREQTDNLLREARDFLQKWDRPELRERYE